jgi:hypothetical protein
MVDPPRRARVTMPDWLWGGDPTRMIAECGYHSRNDGSGGGYLLQPQEAYLNQRPDLVRVRTVAGPGLNPSRYADLANLREHINMPVPEMTMEVLERRRRRVETTNQLIDLIKHQMLLLYALPVERLPTQTRYFHESLREVRLIEDPSTAPFNNSAAHVLEIDPILLHRLKIASIWLRIEQDVRLGSGDLAHINNIAEQGLVFSSSMGLYSGIYMFDAYMGPLMAAGSPGIWAFNVIRSFGSLVFTLGTFVSGTDEDASDFLQLISIPRPHAAVPFPKLSETAGTDTLHWWGARLNLLFGVLSDLAVFTDLTGNYLATKHLQAILTIEQIFRRTTSMLVSHRDIHGRRALFFTLLDSLESITGFDILKMCQLSHAQATLDRLHEELPKGAAEVLLPSAKRGVDALKEMQEGFFIRRQMGSADLELQLRGSGGKQMSPEDGVARYLKVLRDATHGHGSNKATTAALTDALLAHHDGEIPNDVGLLAYLYLLDVLAQPARLRRVLFRSGR